MRESTLFPGMMLPEPRQRIAPALSKPLLGDGPGTELLAIFKRYGAPECESCNDYARWMNSIGCSGCEEKRNEIVGHLEDERRRLSWLQLLLSSALAVLDGKFSFAACVDEAIALAKVKEGELEAEKKKQLESESAAGSAGIIAVSFRHGIGDMTNFAHMIPLYTRRGYKFQVHPEYADTHQIFRAGGAEIIGSAPTKMPWAQAKGRDNKARCNFSRPPLPDIGRAEDLWAEYCAVKLDFGPQVTDGERESVRRFLDRAPRPYIAMHTMGFPWGKYRNYADAPTIELQTRLLERFGGTVIHLDRDRQAPHNNLARVCHFRDFNPGQLYEVLRQCDLLIGIDSGPLHFVRFTDTPAIGIWNANQPADFVAPRAQTVNVVSKHLATRDEAEWNIRRGDDGPSAIYLCELASEILGATNKRQVTPPTQISSEFSATMNAIRQAADGSTYDHRPTLHPADIGLARKMGHDFLRYARLKWAVAHVLKPKRICEVGVGGGLAAMAFLSACPSAECLGIDNGQDDDLNGVSVLNYVQSALKERGYNARIDRRDSRTLTSLPGKFDLVHIDANHSEALAYADVRLALRSARWVLVDDMLSASVSVAVFRALADDRPSAEWASFDGLTGSVLIDCGA